MAKIEAGNAQYFLINGIPKQRGAYEVVTDTVGGIELVGIRLEGRESWVEDCQLKPVTEYTDGSNNSIPTLAAFYSYITPFFFQSGGGGGGGGSNPDAILQNGNSFGTTVTIGSNDNQPVVIETNNTPRLTVGSGGNVNVANLSGAGDRIVVADNSGNLSATIDVSNINNVASNAILQNGNSFGTTVTIGSNDDFDLQFETNDTPRVTIDTNGKVSITNLSGFGNRVVVADDNGELSTSLDINTITDVTDNAILQYGNTFGTDVIIGTNDYQSVIIETNNTPRVTVDENGNFNVSTGNVNVATGNVNVATLAGIGDRLVVADSSGTLSATIEVTDINNVASNAILQNGNSFGTNVIIGSNDSQSVIIETNNTARLTVDSDGKVNVGDLSGVGNRVVVANDNGDLSATIDVSDINNVANNAILQDGNSFGAPVIIGSNDNQPVIIETNNTPRFTINLNGEVNAANLGGIGDRLVVADDSGSLSATIDVTNISNAILQDGNSFGAAVTIGSNDSQPVIIETDNIPRFTIDENGDVNVGNLSGTGSRIVVADDSGNLSATIDVTNITNISNAILQDGNSFGAAVTIGSNDNQPVVIKTSNAPRFTVDENGNVNVGNLSGSGFRVVVADDNGNLSATIDDSNITPLPTINPSTVLGRGSTSGVGQPEQITLGSGLVMTGTQLSADIGNNLNSLQRLSEVFQDFGTFAPQPHSLGALSPSNSFANVSESPFYGVRELVTAGGGTSGYVTFTGNHPLTNQAGYVKLKTRVRYIDNGVKKTSILGFSPVQTYAITTLPANAAGFWIVMNAPNPPVVEIMNANSNTRTRQVITCNPYQWNEYEIRVSAGSISYYLNNVLVGTLTTNIPTTTLTIGHSGYQENPANGTPILRMDYYYIAPNN
jgi:hypothetical protein